MATFGKMTNSSSVLSFQYAFVVHFSFLARLKQKKNKDKVVAHIITVCTSSEMSECIQNISMSEC